MTGIRRDADRAFMTRALALAERGLYTTTPNPRVGCVIVRDGARDRRRLARARRRAARRSQRARRRARARRRSARRDASTSRSSRATTTAARRPAPTRLLAAGVARVVAAMADPNPRGGARRRAPARGRHRRSTSGCSRTRRASSIIGFVIADRRAAGRGCASRSRRASTAAPRSRTATSQWITGEAARADGHRWRARACAILTGIGTVLQDDPQLTVRGVADAAPAAARHRRPPWRDAGRRAGAGRRQRARSSPPATRNAGVAARRVGR